MLIKQWEAAGEEAAFSSAGRECRRRSRGLPATKNLPASGQEAAGDWELGQGLEHPGAVGGAAGHPDVLWGAQELVQPLRILHHTVPVVALARSPRPGVSRGAPGGAAGGGSFMAVVKVTL